MQVPFLAVMMMALAAPPAFAQDCSESRLGEIVDRTAGAMRKQNATSQPALREKFLRLAKLKGWDIDRAVERAYTYVRDDRTTEYDSRAAELLVRFNDLGDVSKGTVDCARLKRLEEVSQQLLEISAAKTAHVSARLSAAIRDSEMKSSLVTPPAPAPAPSAPHPQPKAQPQPQPRAQTPAQPHRSAKPAQRQKSGPWATTTQTAPPPTVAAMATLPPLEQVVDETFSFEEIRTAGRGFFGSLSSELAGVIEFAFRSYGRPTGYILGAEGGAAFLAGLRYGEGRLVTKRFGEEKVFWQGPSVGYDFGLAGSRVMVLVYNIKEPGQLFTRFVGVEGAAYLVGGAGITFHKRGKLVLAPIRTGLGVRIGANVGYLKFTSRPSINPF